MLEVFRWATRSFNVIRLSRRFSAEQRYHQRDLSQMRALAELVIRTVRPFECIRRLTTAEMAVLEAAHVISTHVREDATGALHLRQSAQMELREISVTNGHGGA